MRMNIPGREDRVEKSVSILKVQRAEKGRAGHGSKSGVKGDVLGELRAISSNGRELLGYQ